MKTDITIVKVFAWLFLIIGLLLFPVILYYGYLIHPELIGKYYIPSEMFSEDMKAIYNELFQAILAIVSGLLIINDSKKGYWLFLLSLVLYLIIYLSSCFNQYPFEYIKHEMMGEMLIRLIVYGMPAFFIIRIIVNQRKNTPNTTY